MRQHSGTDRCGHAAQGNQGIAMIGVQLFLKNRISQMLKLEGTVKTASDFYYSPSAFSLTCLNHLLCRVWETTGPLR